METNPQPEGVSPELRGAWRFSLIQQAAILFTVFAMDDRTRVFAALIALVVYWACVGFIMFLRRSKPILIDLLFVRWSFPLLWLIALLSLVQIAKARIQ